MKRTAYFPAPNKILFKALVSLFFYVAVFIMTSVSASGQAIQVNPDGTHTIIINNGSDPTIQVNPDGTHTVIIDHGNTQTWVNPDGTHSTLVHSDTNQPILVNPDGTHTQIIRNGNTEIRIAPDGSQSTYTLIEHSRKKAKKSAAVRQDKKGVRNKHLP